MGSVSVVPQFPEVPSAALAKEVFQDDSISGVGFEGYIYKVAEEGDQANQEVNDYVEHHMRLHTGWDICSQSGADNHQ